MASILGGIAFVVVVVGALQLIAVANHNSLDRWAAENGLTIVSWRRQVWSLRFLPRTRGQRVYAIEVVDGEGRTRTGVAKVGDVFFGAAVHRVDVRWDD